MEYPLKNSYHNPCLISPLAVEQLTQDIDNCRIIEIRKKDSYDRGHILNSVQIERSHIESSYGIVTGMRADKSTIQNLLSKLGCNKNTHIVLFDERGSYDSCRFWWILKMYGHHHVSIIDGGIDGWKYLGLPLVEIAFTPKENKFIFEKEIDESVLAYLYDVVNNDSATLIDVRTIEEFKGEIKLPNACSAGRIPYAISMPHTLFLEEKTLFFKEKQVVENILQQIGLNKKSAYILYCHSGIRSAHTLFVLKELLKFELIKNYDGSWIEYSSISTLPIERD
ncbi:MAG: sulfurtransferase [Brevinema sp.]